MKDLYKRILDSNKSGNCISVDVLIKQSGFFSEVQKTLFNLGIKVNGLSDSKISSMFVALNDIVYVTDNSSEDFYIATMSPDIIADLWGTGRICTTGEKVNAIINGSSVQNINKYLKDSKLRLMKLDRLIEVRETFIVDIKTMKPYPTLDNCYVYGLSQISSKYLEVYKKLIHGTQTVVCGKDAYVGTFESLSTPCVASGTFRLQNTQGSYVDIHIWKIDSVVTTKGNIIIDKLYTKAFRYGNDIVTLNRDIINAYYGEANVVSRLESKGCRYRWCLQDLITNPNVDEAVVCKQYGVELPKCNMNTKSLLAMYLKDNKEQINKNPDVVHVRCLKPIGSILAGKASYYLTINLSRLKYDLKELSDDELMEVLPKKMRFYSVSETMGYQFVEVVGTSEEMLVKEGIKEFTRQFGAVVDEKFYQLGSAGIKDFPLKTQMRFHQLLMYSYTEYYTSTSEVIYEICKNNNITCINDDLIQFLYINELARMCKRLGVRSEDFGKNMYLLINFIILCRDEYKANKKLKDIWLRLCIVNLRKEIQHLDTIQDLTSYRLCDETNGRKSIVTNYGKIFLKVSRNDWSIYKEVQCIFRGVDLGMHRYDTTV